MQQIPDIFDSKIFKKRNVLNRFNFDLFETGNKDNLFFSAIAGLTLFIILFVIVYVFYVAYPVLSKEGLVSFVTGNEWNYGKSIYGIRFFALSTVYLTVLTLLFAVPLGLFAAIYLAEFASARVEAVVRPLIELLVGIPSVVYGIFGFFILEDIFQYHIDPFLDGTLGFISIFRDINPNDGFHLLLASTVLAVMILPTIVTISQDAIRMVSTEYRDASFSLGATKWETIKKVVLPVAKGGIIASIILGTMRAMGETMAVLMLYGGASSHAPVSILDTGKAMTSVILGDLGSHFNNDEAVSALFAVAALLFAMEILFVLLIRLIGRSYEPSKV